MPEFGLLEPRAGMMLRLKREVRTSGVQLAEGASVAVIGGGPAGSFFSYFLLQMTARIGQEISLDIYEPRDFSQVAPQGCNMCGGIISESLVQTLAAEGINLPQGVVQRGIDSYFLHMDVGSVRIANPSRERRIAAVHRGAGPRGIKDMRFRSFDGHLLEMATAKGARLIRARVAGIERVDSRLRVKPQNGEPRDYDLVAAAVGINAGALKMFEGLGLRYRPPRSTKTYICEFLLGREVIRRYLGSCMHVFLLNIPRLEFGALIPKGDYVTLCLLGSELDKELVQAFVNSAEVRRAMPPGWQPPPDFCRCSPKISIEGAVEPFADRLVFVGDCGVTRLYKDGIGAAYRTSKAAAMTASLHGVSAEAFRRRYWPTCKMILNDNRIGKLVFLITREIQKRRFARGGLWQMVLEEQKSNESVRRMSGVLWDTFTGSAPYRHVFLRSLHPLFWGGFLWHMMRGGRRNQ